ncbi:hypothetical protein [Clostridium manihotivorum]|uniref:Uncharacterized protein n=1 Tax=Clostridium manihotivorum TaxID=2320868 RepID=A0A3R5V657_9CLOT|nr:hypothetical protein [Clostridium manihotivorum]QAA31084.1 hypothetical protein C1I91_05075 [Clostridium manihotivorum]
MNKNEKGSISESHDLKRSVIQLTIIHLAVISLLNFLIIINDKSYYYLAAALLFSSFIIAIINVSIGLKKKFVKTAKYVWITILSNILSFSVYLNLIEILNASLTYVKIILILNYVILEIILVYIRIIRKDKTYIRSVSSGKHSKYVKKDLFLVVAISAVVILTAKLLDNGQIYVGRIGIMVTEIFGTPLMTIAIVLHVHAFANYLYNIKRSSEY